jgi:two-component system, NarL family, sensor kinase
MADPAQKLAPNPLSELLADIASQPPLAQMLDRILDAACRLVQADTGIIGLYDEVADVMRTAAVRQPVVGSTAPTHARGEGLGGHILATGTAFHGRYGDLPRPTTMAIAEHQVLGLPLLWMQRRLGYFGVSVAPPRTFQPAQVETFELIARVAAIAIEHARRYEEEQRTSLRFELIAKIAAEIHRESNCELMLQRAADVIHEVLQFPNVDIPLVDPDDPSMLVVRVRGGNYKRKIQREDRLPVSAGIMGAAVRERKSQLVNDVSNDPRYVCPPGVHPALAELAVPICSNDRVLGVLNVESDRPFTELDRRSLEVVADYLAVAIDNSILFEQAGNVAVLAERQRLARELHDNVTQILSSISLLSQTLTTAWQRSPEEGERRAARLQQLAQTAFAEMRMLLHQLAPTGQSIVNEVSRRSRSLVGVEMLREHALPSALTKLLAAVIPESIAVRSSFSNYVPQRLDLEEALYRVCQEAVSNTVRHANARRIRVEAAVTQTHAVLRVSDDGNGLTTNFRPGVGLGSMRTRIESLRGQFRIAQNEPQGTLIEARLPRLDREASPNQGQ